VNSSHIHKRCIQEESAKGIFIHSLSQLLAYYEPWHKKGKLVGFSFPKNVMPATNIAYTMCIRDIIAFGSHSQEFYFPISNVIHFC